MACTGRGRGPLAPFPERGENLRVEPASPFPKRGESLRMGGASATLTIQDRLGEGGQGIVYRASMGGAYFAEKWFRPSSRAAELRRSIGALVDRGRPPSPAFVWPMELVTSDRLDGFGY